jgi:signal transduction histidine kinase
MSEGAASRALPSPSTRGRERHVRARNSANRKIGFIAHSIVYVLGSLLLFVVAGFFAGVVVLIAWTMALFVHGFFSVLAPTLRSRWIAKDLSLQRVDTDAERAHAESRHARSLAELSAAIAHEIRNPITAAKSLVQQIAEDPALPENREYASVAVQELDRVERSIAHLLRFAREEPRRVVTAHMGAIVDAALALLRDRLTEHRVEVRVAADFDAMGTLEADPEQLRRVLANVIGNAIDAFVEAGTPEPRIDVRAGQNLARTEVWLTIADNGPGIPPDAIAKVFTPFYTSKAAGTGLGLALSKKIIEEHGGSIEVKSPPGGGAEFVITLPLGAPHTTGAETTH